MTIKQAYKLTLSLLTPLHIGTGQELRRDFDYVTHGGRTWVMDANAFLEAIYWRDGNPDERILGRPASELLAQADFDEASPYFRYVLRGRPRSSDSGAVIREQVKTVYDDPFLPGSSIKGALRTALAWHGFESRGLALDVSALRDNPKQAGQGLERTIFGRNPNFDLLRALHVADTAPQTKEQLQLINAQVFTGSDRPGAPIELEAVRSDTVFTTRLTIDQFQHSPAAARELQHGARWAWLEQLPAIARAHALERVTEERAWYQTRKYTAVAGFYGQLQTVLQRNRLSDQQFLLQIGWGGGWSAKTIGRPLQRDGAQWESLLNDKRLSPARMRRGAGGAFPKSRRAVAANDKPAAPLGWCLVEMEEIDKS